MLDSVSLHKFHIDHIYNQAKGGPTVSNNLAYACSICNHKKGENLAGYLPELDRAFILYHPRKDYWSEHFHLQDDGRIALLTNTAKATAALLLINRQEIIAERLGLMANILLIPG